IFVAQHHENAVPFANRPLAIGDAVAECPRRLVADDRRAALPRLLAGLIDDAFAIGIGRIGPGVGDVVFWFRGSLCAEGERRLLGLGLLSRRNLRCRANRFETDPTVLFLDELAERRKQLLRPSAARLDDDPAAPTPLVHSLFDQRAGARGLFIGAKPFAPIDPADTGFGADLGDDRAD